MAHSFVPRAYLGFYFWRFWEEKAKFSTKIDKIRGRQESRISVFKGSPLLDTRLIHRLVSSCKKSAIFLGRIMKLTKILNTNSEVTRIPWNETFKPWNDFCDKRLPEIPLKLNYIKVLLYGFLYSVHCSNIDHRICDFSNITIVKDTHLN